MSQEIVVSAKQVKKQFILPHEKSSDSLKRAVTSLFSSRDSGYEVQRALRGVSFEIEKGEFFGIVGRNGSGKSTLLKMLAGIYEPTSGAISVQGKLVPFIELGVGFNPELTGRENVYLNGALLGFSTKEVDARYDEIVAFAELEEFMDQKLKNYSSGMQVRLAFSVATHAEADVLLIDEVLAVGDADFQRKCYDFFKGLKKQKKTVIFVTHDMGAVREYCDRAVLIKEGKIACQGKPDLVANEYMKLFNPDSEDEATSGANGKDGKRWGNGDVRFTSIKAQARDDTLTLTLTIKAGAKAMNDLVVGYRLKDGEDRLVAGGNTLNADGQQRLALAAGESKRLKFVMPNIFGAGRFSVGATIRLTDKVTFCDDWSDATSFQNTREESYYPVICPAVLTVD